MDEPSELDIRGPAVAGMTLALALLSHLKAKGVLTAVEANEVLETALNGLESTLPANDPATHQARVLVEAMARAMASANREQGR